MSAGDVFVAVGGTLVTPWNASNDLVQVVGGICRKRTLKKTNITAPGDSGAVTFQNGNYVYSASLNAIYTEGAAASDAIGDTIRGTLTVDMGTGERWTGTADIDNVQLNPDWGPGGAIGIQFDATWTGTVTVSNS